MSQDDDRLGDELRAAVPPATLPPGLADRAFRAAMNAAPGPFADWFVLTARRAALVGAIATALVWGGLLLREPSSAETKTATAAFDPAEAAYSLWVGHEEVTGGE